MYPYKHVVHGPVTVLRIEIISPTAECHWDVTSSICFSIYARAGAG
jgi:hypothetical protein